MIDLVITNSLETNAEVMDTPKITEHNIINKKKTGCKERNVIMKRNYCEYNTDKFKKEMSKENLQVDKNMNFDQKVEMIIQSIKNVVEKVIPKKEVIQKDTYKCKWYTRELHSIQKDRDRLYKIATLTRVKENWEEYKQPRNIYTNTLR
jgi:hypothetical protein